METDHRRTGHEQSDAAARPLLIFGAGLVALVLAILVLSAWLLKAFRSPEGLAGRAHSSAAGDSAPRSSKTAVPLSGELQEMRSTENELLGGYSWVNREAGIVRIPIERAMDLIVNERLPNRVEDPGKREPSQGEKP